MSQSLSTLLAELESLAAYAGPWRPLRDEGPLLRARVQELRERETRLDDLLVVALVGGSGVGKSTLLNALAGDQLAATSEMRPCTSTPTVYQPPGAKIGLEGWKRIHGSALERMVIIDTPDSDTIAREHRTSVIEALGQADLIMICGSPDKYLDDATWSLLRPLQGLRTMICIETKADKSATDIRTHWLERLKEQGFDITAYFRVSARRTLDRKLGAETNADEFDFPNLERYLREELSTEQVRRIKRSNAVGLLHKTLAALDERVATRLTELESAREHAAETDKTLTREVCDLIAKRLFAEPHLWNFALGREIGVRAKGIVGTSYRLLEWLRTLPTRMGSWFSIRLRDTAGRQAASLLTETSETTLDVAGEGLQTLYDNHRGAIGLEMARVGFESLPNASFNDYAADLSERLSSVLRGPARDRLVRRARILTSWLTVLLFDAPPVAFIAFAGYRIVGDYFEGRVLTGDYFLHAGAVLAILLGVELAVLSILARFCAWSARRSAVRDLRMALLSGGIAYKAERAAIDEAVERAARVSTVRELLNNSR